MKTKLTKWFIRVKAMLEGSQRSNTGKVGNIYEKMIDTIWIILQIFFIFLFILIGLDNLNEIVNYLYKNFVYVLFICIVVVYIFVLLYCKSLKEEIKNLKGEQDIYLKANVRLMKKLKKKKRYIKQLEKQNMKNQFKIEKLRYENYLIVKEQDKENVYEFPIKE